jgi:hypothetical protein
MPTASQKPKGYGIGVEHQEADLAAGSGGACPEHSLGGGVEHPDRGPLWLCGEAIAGTDRKGEAQVPTSQ